MTRNSRTVLTGSSAVAALSFALALLAALLVPALTQAATPGDLDPSFGPGGTVMTNFGRGAARSVAVDSRDRVVIAGTGEKPHRHFALARYKRDGDLDPRFGGDGKVTTHFKHGATAYAVAIDSRDRMVVAGAIGSNRGFAIARYRSNGKLDHSFGHRGKAKTAFGEQHVGVGKASSVAIDSHGRIVVAGYTGGSGRPGRFAVARYKPSGKLDHSFSSDGRVKTRFRGDSFEGSAFANSVAIDSRDRIVAAGFTGNGGFAVARYRADGRLDPSFWGNGKVRTHLGGAIARSVAIDSNDGIVAVGLRGRDDFQLVRYTERGQGLDPSFGVGGKVRTPFRGGRGAYAVAIDPQGRIVAAGSCHVHGRVGFAVARYEQNGDLDPSFGDAGKVKTPFQGGSLSARAVAIDSRDRIVAGGSYFVVTRYIG